MDMDREEKQAFIRRQARENLVDPEGAKILWSRHGILELVNEDWNRVLLEEAFQYSEIIEDYPPLHRPLPDCLVMTRLATGEPCHAVLAIDAAKDRLFVVTVYKPDAEEWENDYKTRRK